MVNIYFNLDKKDPKAISSNPKQLDDVLRNLPEYMTNYHESKKPLSNTKYSGNSTSGGSKFAFPSNIVLNDKSAGMKSVNNNLLIKGKESSSLGGESGKKSVATSGKASKVLTGVGSSDKKVFHKIK